MEPGFMPNKELLFNDAIELLKELVATPSYSGEEEHTAAVLTKFFKKKSIEVRRIQNNVVVQNFHFREGLPVLLLNSHHDTVKPNPAYTLDPFLPLVMDGKLFGLGSNDAGGALVSLAATFLHFYHLENLPFNLLFVASAEEEISGSKGIELAIKSLGKVDLAIVGEPSGMEMAIAEKGLMVLDCLSTGRSGHAARCEGENAIYKAMKDIAWFQSHRFSKVSDTLGEVLMNVTLIQAGTQHNVVPAECRFTVDVRCTDAYSHEELLEEIRKNVQCQVVPRSMRIRPSAIPGSHPFVKKAKELGFRTYGSPTTSDQALMPFPSVKIGPGDSARSHTADEFIYLDEITDGIEKYIQLISSIQAL